MNMNPRQRANDLYDKYSDIAGQQIECCLLLIDEIIDCCPTYGSNTREFTETMQDIVDEQLEYWTKVRLEILKIKWAGDGN